MKHIAFAMILVFLLLACTSLSNQRKEFNQTIGMDKSSLISRYGDPKVIQELGNGDEILIYGQTDTTYVPAEFFLYSQGALSSERAGFYTPFLQDYEFSSPDAELGYNITYYCNTIFLLKKGKVVSWRRVGNDCASADKIS